MQPQIIQGGSFTDERGTLSFVNDFAFKDVKRFYCINHPDARIVRAWQGHKIEHKYFYVAAGSFAIGWVKIDDWENPSPDLIAEHTVLTDKNPVIFSLPSGYANGIKALQENSALIIYSNLTTEESANDRWSFEANRWINWQQFHI
jgi:dTDP-4-dehydrorhamnose 3,5-epimerase-like enzyme